MPHASSGQWPVAREDEASEYSELRLGFHPETPVIELCRKSANEANGLEPLTVCVHGVKINSCGITYVKRTQSQVSSSSRTKSRACPV